VGKLRKRKRGKAGRKKVHPQGEVILTMQKKKLTVVHISAWKKTPGLGKGERQERKEV